MSGTRPKRPPLREAFGALRSRNFRLYLTGRSITQLGVWMQSTALSWYVLNRTHSPFALGTVSTFQFLPVLLLTLFGGVVADRFPKQRLLMVTQTVMALQALSLGIATSTGVATLPLIYLLASVQGVATAFTLPAHLSFVTELVEKPDLPKAVALNFSVQQLTRLGGPAIAGVAIATLGFAPCFFLNSAGYVAVLASLLMMRPNELYRPDTRPRGAVLDELGEVLKYAWSTPDIFMTLAVMLVLGIFGYNFQVFTPLIARFVLHTTSVGFGLLNSVQAVGSLVAGLTVAWLGTATRKVVFSGAIAFALVLTALGAASSWFLVAPLLLLLGFTSSVFLSTNNARLQLITPPELRGRMMGLDGLMIAGTTPIGSLIVGGLADEVGVSAMLAMMGCACFLGVAGGVGYARRFASRLLPDELDDTEAMPRAEVVAGSDRPAKVASARTG